jgi:hypothetical protein
LKKLFGGFALVLGMSAAWATESPPVITPLSPEVLAIITWIKPHSTAEWLRFDTLHKAAVYGAVRLEQCSHYYECSGFILKDPKGKFVLAPVRTDYESDRVLIIDSTGPADWTLAADLHSHPCLPDHATGLFSPPDMINSIVSRTVSFMVDLCTGDVHEFIPGTTRPDETRYGDMWLTGGTVIGHVAAFKDEPSAKEGP